MCKGGEELEYYPASNLLNAALFRIDDLLCKVMWNIHQEEYDSPFSNSGIHSSVTRMKSGHTIGVGTLTWIQIPLLSRTTLSGETLKQFGINTLVAAQKRIALLRQTKYQRC